MTAIVNLNAPTIEYTIFIAEDGQQYILDSTRERNVLTQEGDGIPPIEYVTERGPFQHGETLRGYFLRPRVIQLLIRQDFKSRNKYWEGRADLLNAIRPNRGVNGVLRRILSTGQKRDITVAIQQGPAFAPRKIDAWDEYAFTETLRFIAHNPVYFDPNQQVTTWVHPQCSSFPYTFPIFLDCPMTFPITFPIMFQAFGGEDDTEVVYDGDWEEYPTFVLTGPMQYITIRNVTTGEKIVLDYTLAEGEVATIVLTYGTKTVTLADGTSIISGITTDSDLATFHLKPKTTNMLRIVGLGAGANSSLVMSYYNRYIGLGA